MKIGDDQTEVAVSNDHIQEGNLWILVGSDYLEGSVIDPDAKGEILEREGWIWGFGKHDQEREYLT